MSETVTTGDGFLLAALAAAAGRPASEVAAVAGVSERTIRRWNRRPSFIAAVSQLRDGMLDSVMGRLLSANSEAVDALIALLKSNQDQVRLSAAGRLLDSTLRVRHQLKIEGELLSRLAELESLVKEILPHVGNPETSGQGIERTTADSGHGEEGEADETVEGRPD